MGVTASKIMALFLIRAVLIGLVASFVAILGSYTVYQLKAGDAIPQVVRASLG